MCRSNSILPILSACSIEGTVQNGFSPNCQGKNIIAKKKKAKHQYLKRRAQEFRAIPTSRIFFFVGPLADKEHRGGHNLTATFLVPEVRRMENCTKTQKALLRNADFNVIPPVMAV